MGEAGEQQKQMQMQMDRETEKEGDATGLKQHHITQSTVLVAPIRLRTHLVLLMRSRSHLLLPGQHLGLRVTPHLLLVLPVEVSLILTSIVLVLPPHLSLPLLDRVLVLVLSASPDRRGRRRHHDSRQGQGQGQGLKVKVKVTNVESVIQCQLPCQLPLPSSFLPLLLHFTCKMFFVFLFCRGAIAVSPSPKAIFAIICLIRAEAKLDRVLSLKSST